MALPYTSILAGASGQSGYTIPYSCRFVSGNSAYLNRTPPGTGDRQKWTLSAWVKKCDITNLRDLFCTATSGDRIAYFNSTGGGFTAACGIYIEINNAQIFGSAASFRDTSAWYHIVVATDTTQVTAANRVRVYVNNVQMFDIGTNSMPAQNTNCTFNTTVEHRINRGPASNYNDQYISNFYWIDGQQLTPSSFGQTNTSGVWVPKAYSGTYGTNGFLMEFLNSAALGTDTSGNGNTFTSNGLVAGDQMTDTPTLNYCNIGVLNQIGSAAGDITFGNLKSLHSAAVSAGFKQLGSWEDLTSGKWYWEAQILSQNFQYPYVGVVSTGGGATKKYGNYSGSSGANWSGWGWEVGATISSGLSYGDTTNTTTTAGDWSTTYAVNDYAMVALDLDNNKIYFGKNGTWLDSGNPAAGTGYAGSLLNSPTYAYTPYFGNYGSSLMLNFGSTAFAYTPPTGFSRLRTANLPAPAIKDGSAHFQTALHTGTGSALTINQSGNSTFTSDFVWTKGRSGATNHVLSNVISGTGKYLSSNATTAETTDAQALTAFGAGSISYGTLAAANTNAATYVDWMWKGGGAGVSNTSGSITSTVSANTTAGISIVKWTGTAANATVGHGLGVAPKFMILKPNAVTEWPVYHGSLANTEYTALNTTAAKATGATYWNSTTPASSVFSIGSSTNTNNTLGMIAYCFAEVAGFSKFGAYTGNGSADGPFICTGFKPAFIIVKRTDSTSDWRIYDTTMRTYNVNDRYLAANGPDLEAAGGDNGFDIVSNGFKSRNSSVGTNASGGTMIYAAFASNPFGGIGAAPATAR